MGEWKSSIAVPIMDDIMINHFVHALAFSAEKHKNQRRKDAQITPYINHPIELVNVLVNEGGVMSWDVLCAALLHDVIEDTQTTEEELITHFGKKVTAIVRELTDDKSLAKEVRKSLQIAHAPFASHEAKLVKLADKICNLRDILVSPPAGWDLQRKQDYFAWAAAVIAGIRGTNSKLEKVFDGLLQEAQQMQ
jgi:guanosine-3',5'-bis(diphosphate) 3'-pyrophosphohydrolase